VPHDTIRLENAIFKGLTHTGVLATGLFAAGTVAASADSHLVYYNKATGALFYDGNGAKAGGDVQFATLAHNLALTHSDFFVI
jgi:serralysin